MTKNSNPTAVSTWKLYHDMKFFEVYIRKKRTSAGTVRNGPVSTNAINEQSTSSDNNMARNDPAINVSVEAKSYSNIASDLKNLRDKEVNSEIKEIIKKVLLQLYEIVFLKT